MEQEIPTVISSRREAKKEIMFQSDPDPLMEGIFDEIKNRSFRHRSNEDAKKMISMCLSSEPITSLKEDELKKLRKYLQKQVVRRHIEHVNNKFGSLLQDEVYFVDSKLAEESGIRSLGMSFLNASTLSPYNESNLNALKALNVKPLSPEELAHLLRDPVNIDRYSYVNGNITSSVISQGSRPLYKHDENNIEYYDGYDTPELFKEKLDRVKKNTHKKSLIMMDVGGNAGRALLDAKDLDPTLKTINMTFESLPTISGDVIVRRPAEYMPKVFEEKIDIIESNYAFRYFLFPDIAMKNIVKALSVGGEANIDFGVDRSPLSMEELERRVRGILVYLSDLEKEGYLEVEKRGYDPLDIDPKYIFYGRYIKIIKKKSMMGFV